MRKPVLGAQDGTLDHRYQILDEIGQGEMGRVFRAHDLLLDREVAVKILDRQPDADARRATLAEARASARLMHPAIPTIYDVVSEDDCDYIVMELAPGESLRDLLRRDGPLAQRSAIRIAADIADALDHAHRQGVLPCDVKPQNVLVADEGPAMLVDFEIARAMAEATGSLQAHDITGSVPYLAPEQVVGDRVDARTDVYALGAVLYEMLVGKPPFEGDTVSSTLVQRLTVDPAPLSSFNPDISPEIELVVLTALRRSPAERFPSAAAFREALAGLGGAHPDAPTIRITRPRRPGSTRPRGAQRFLPSKQSAVVLGAALLALAVLAIFTWRVNSAAVPGDAWGTIQATTCEWSSATTPPGDCFGQREAGYRLRLMERQEDRWLVWDPGTRNVAYVDASAIKAER